MATTKKITQLPNAAPVTGTELVPLVQGGETRKSTLSALWPANQIIEVNNATDNVGDLVYVSGASSGGKPTVQKVDISNFYKMPAIGLIIEVISPTTARVLMHGLYTSMGAFTPNGRYWVSSTGTLTLSPPTAGFQQLVAIGLDENTLIFRPSFEMFRRFLWHVGRSQLSSLWKARRI